MSELDRNEAREVMVVVSSLGLRRLNWRTHALLTFSYIVAITDMLT